eukprot:CAMPEP_0170356640 /NCGR_PEP_ID=MMETSP0117_2-20130122/1283_1 /TAXON_ID=400756 /ORGANISM="Durinskia baltica, Strain CSIRO CS-38" /LENGTH=379 /DNA_ID=CAMNT_0010610757 /DNA_START=9 /DNA_END=1145 /DNA_ORIENTATION=-
MIKRFLKASVFQKVKKVAIPLGFATVTIAAYQGWALRDQYLTVGKMDPPTGPTSGLEKWIDKARIKKDEILDAIIKDNNVVSRGISKVKGKWEEFEKERSGENKVANTTEGEFHGDAAENISSKKIIKLIVVGDSLVAGVGNDDSSASPALPQMIAATLSQKLHADVVWISSGIVGGTVVDLKEKALPVIRDKMDKFRASTSSENPVEYVVVVTCGLNDWKSIFMHFPFGLWPSQFNIKLKELLGEIESICIADGSSYHIFIPNLPLVCIQSDPKYVMGVKPLGYFVDAMSYIWDVEKEKVAQEDDKVHFIGSPLVDTDYATPGGGNVSSDGVHPSTQGYFWWAQHIGEHVIKVISKSKTSKSSASSSQSSSTEDSKST